MLGNFEKKKEDKKKNTCKSIEKQKNKNLELKHYWRLDGDQLETRLFEAI